MRRFGNISRSAAFQVAGLACLVAAAAAADNSRPAAPASSPARSMTSADIQRQQAKMKADFARKDAEIKRKIDQRAKSLQPGQDELRQQAARYLNKTTPSAPLPPFNAATAPPPADCLKAFVAAGRSATSLEQLMSYLPQDKVDALKARQSMYDPKVAASARETHRKWNPKISDEDLNHITGPPYDFAL